MQTHLSDVDTRVRHLDTINPPSHAEIAERAFGLYQQRGGAIGLDLDDWLEAERQLWLERVPLIDDAEDWHRPIDR